jgi:hypothetical protein
MRSVGSALFVMVAALALAACPDTTALPDGSGGQGGAGGAATVITWAASDCGICVEQACAGQVTNCAAEPECAARLECLRACPIGENGDADLACEAACPMPTAAGAANAVTALDGCRLMGDGANCEACGHAPTGHPILDQTCAPPTAPGDCDACEEEFCCETRCLDLCQDYIGCMQGCNGETTCQDGCAASHPDGVTEFGRWLACQLPHCRDVCTSLIPGPCLDCGIEQCPNPFADCFANASCFLRFFCGTQCDTVACYDACDAQYPEAGALMGALLLCVSDECTGGACDGTF